MGVTGAELVVSRVMSFLVQRVKSSPTAHLLDWGDVWNVGLGILFK